MNKRRLHHTWKTLRRIKPWYFLVLSIVLAFLSVLALRYNDQHMVELRDKVIAADAAGVGVEESLQNLQRFVTSHMNADLTKARGVYPPIQLLHTYQRLVKTEGEKVTQQNKAQFDDAMAHCPSSGGSYEANLAQQNCVVNYMADKHNITQQPIPDALYKFDFVSPPWSPDTAGWLIVLTALSFVIFIVLAITNLWFKQNVA